MNDKNLTAAVNVFTKNPDLKELFFTSDGQCFYKTGPAIVHQKEIGTPEDAIETINAGDMALESKKSKVKSEKEDEAIVEDETVIDAESKKSTKGKKEKQK